MPGSIYEQICAKLQNKGVHIVVDTTGDALLAVLDYHPFLIKPNHHELGEIFGEDIRPDDEEKIRFFAAKLQEKGARNVLVSRGKYGATLLAEDGSTHSVGVVPANPVNNVGCGDSMVAGFLAGYADSGDYKTALQWLPPPVMPPPFVRAWQTAIPFAGIRHSILPTESSRRIIKCAGRRPV